MQFILGDKEGELTKLVEKEVTEQDNSETKEIKTIKADLISWHINNVSCIKQYDFLYCVFSVFVSHINFD